MRRQCRAGSGSERNVGMGRGDGSAVWLRSNRKPRGGRATAGMSDAAP